MRFARLCSYPPLPLSTQFRHNEIVYKSGSEGFFCKNLMQVPTGLAAHVNQALRQGSYLDFLLSETERTQGLVGRWQSPDEEPFFPDRVLPPLMPPAPCPMRSGIQPIMSKSSPLFSLSRISLIAGMTPAAHSSLAELVREQHRGQLARSKGACTQTMGDQERVGGRPHTLA